MQTRSESKRVVRPGDTKSVPCFRWIPRSDHHVVCNLPVLVVFFTGPLIVFLRVGVDERKRGITVLGNFRHPSSFNEGKTISSYEKFYEFML